MGTADVLKTDTVGLCCEFLGRWVLAVGFWGGGYLAVGFWGGGRVAKM